MVKVIYIAGSTRSGSTLLGSILGQVEGVFFASEVYRIWHPRDRTAGLCSCGKKEEECEVWSAIFKDAFGDINKVDIERMRYMRDRYILTRRLPFVIIKQYHEKIVREICEYLEITKVLYESIHEITKCSAIVDSSKSPLYAYLLSKVIYCSFNKRRSSCCILLDSSQIFAKYTR